MPLSYPDFKMSLMITPHPSVIMTLFEQKLICDSPLVIFFFIISIEASQNLELFIDKLEKATLFSKYVSDNGMLQLTFLWSSIQSICMVLNSVLVLIFIK